MKKAINLQHVHYGFSRLNYLSKLILIIFTFTAISCATVAPVNRAEICASRGGLVFSGVSYSSETNHNYNFQAGATTVGESETETISCKMPDDKVIACTANALGLSASPKLEYNSGIKGKRFLTGIGYLYIVPGILLKWHYDSQRDEAIKQSLEIYEAESKKCPETNAKLTNQK